MVVTFLIGNGFDINCGLKCTFREICEEYIQARSKSEAIKQFKGNIDRNIDTWADFEMAMNRFLSNFRTEEEALECIRDFKRFMKGVLKREEALFLSRINKKKGESISKAYKDEMKTSLLSFYTGISNNITSKYRDSLAVNKVEFAFVTFNYTRVLGILLDSIETNPSVIHIHGDLDDETVVGIDNDEQLNHNLQFEPTVDLRREFIKTTFNQEYDTDRVFYADHMISDCDVMCVYGMSLGDSDMSWRNKILKWLMNNPDHQLFLFQYDCSKLEYITVPHRMSLEDKAKNAFFNRISIDDAVKEKIRPRIHIPIGRNIFNINGVLTKAEKERVRLENKIKEQNEQAKKRTTGSMQGA